MLAQFIAPSGGDPVTVACPNGPTNGSGIDAEEAWERGKQFALIEGDGVFGIGNWGHVPESLAWYCKASAAGNAVAAYDIAEIFREGYVVNSRGPGGQIITKHYLSDLPTAFYWYQLSANRGFTKAMLAVAQYYALGDQTLKGSHVPRDWGKSLEWLSKAADKQDTVALRMLAYSYAGVRPAPWGMALPPPNDAASKAKAAALALSARKIVTEVNSYCINPVTIQVMVDDLPDASEGRKAKWASVGEVHGWTRTAPMEWECILSLGAAPPSQQNEPLLDQFYRLIRGGSVNSWSYTFTQIPGVDAPARVRETATQAMVEGVEEMAVLLQTISPPSGPQSSTPLKQNPANPAPGSPTVRSSPAMSQTNPMQLPSVMHFCAQHCLTFTLENGRFTNYTNLPGQSNERRVFAIERFTRESVIIHRTDTGSNPLTADYTGRMSDDGNSVSGSGWKITWGAALNTLPGSDEERDRRR